MIEDILKKDLRELSEDEFLGVIKKIKEIGISEELENLFSSKPQLMLLVRIALGMTRSSFARTLNISQKTLIKIEINAARNTKVFPIWSRKVLNLLRKRELIVERDLLIQRWNEWKNRDFEDIDLKLFEKFLREFKSLKLPDDLREIKENDLIRLVKWLKKSTKNFVSIPIELLKVNSQLILIFRLILGLSREEFSKKVGRNKHWIKMLEGGFAFLEDPATLRKMCERLLSLFKNFKLDLECSLGAFRSFKVSSHCGSQIVKGKSITRLEKEEVEKAFYFFFHKTNGFKNFPPNLLMKHPTVLLICRLALGLGHKKFAELIRENERSIRVHEVGASGISFRKAKKISKRLNMIFKNKKISKEEVIKNFIKFKNFIPSFHVCRANFKKLIRSQRLNEFEKEVLEILQKIRGIKIKPHITIENVKGGVVNVDFGIWRNGKLEWLIEVSKLKKPQFLKIRASSLDHKFRGIRLKEKDIKCMIVFWVDLADEILTSEVKEDILKSVFDTDVILLNDEIRRMEEILTK